MRKRSSEADVRRMVSEGCTASEIAAELRISADAVRQMAHRKGLDMKRATSTFWNDARKEVVRQAVADKISALACAQKIGHGCTRNMVLSMARRMGFTFAGKLTDADKTARSRKGNAVRIAMRAAEPRQFKAPKAKPSPRNSIYGGNPKTSPLQKKLDAITANASSRHTYVDRIEPAGKVTLLELGPHTCRWPVGDPQADTFRFCGDQKDFEASYCGRHHKLAHQPSRPRPPSTEPSARRRAA